MSCLKFTGVLSRFVLFMVGNATLAIGCVFAVRNPWGAAPWDVFHMGLARTLGTSLGNVIIMLSIAILVLTLLFGGGWSVRIGTLLNAFLIGLFVNFYQAHGIPPAPVGLFWGSVYLVVGVFLLSLGMVLYVRTGLGAGARDGLTLVISQRTGLTVGRVKIAMETIVTFAGWALGGNLGVGTVFIAISAGPICDLLFRFLGRGALPANISIPTASAGTSKSAAN